MDKPPLYPSRIAVLIVAAVLVLLPGSARAQTCARTIQADVVALDQVFFWNRLGAVQPQGMIYALKRDVVPIVAEKGLVEGNVRLRDGKRPRPIVLRMNIGDCLQINFENLLAPYPVDNQQPATRTASVHAIGMQLVGSIDSDGSNVGKNGSSLVAPGGSATYTLYAEREGSHLLYSAAAQTGGEGNGGSINAGLFGAITVQQPDAEWYRSQVTAVDIKLATIGTTPAGQPIIDYNAVYPKDHVPSSLAGLPILNMLQDNKIVHSDLTAIITGPKAGRFPAGTYNPVKVSPDRDQPYREFVTIYHDEIGAVQAFPQFEDPVLGHTLHSVRDAFAINYGTGGIGAEILANRFGVGPMADCTECKYEDFFLTAWAVGDPAMVVDVPANAPCTKDEIEAGKECYTAPGKKATMAFYPDDPSNVLHSYLRDHVKFRILHAGSKEHHIHHQHTHQWLHTPDQDTSSYLDSQAIGPGSSFSLEIAYHGSGNRNLAVGDSIFHCHFYPHFAQGMWAMWRVHDVLETGTHLDEKGRPAFGSRALPDGEIMAGTPIPGVVPVPTIAMAPLPQADVYIDNGQVQVKGDGNPGYPFFVPGVAGHRPPHPPLDTIDDGGLPRHVITGGTFTEVHTRLDFTKTLLKAVAHELPETGTPIEEVAMKFHATREHPSYTPEGTAANFITNGLGPQAGAPFADPCVTDEGKPVEMNRLYKGANIQLDVKFNKAGWHFPQQRITTLWGDVDATRNGTRPPEPLFFRANSRDCIEYHLANLTPGHYEQDDFQVRTPTDITGQHIHLVKFDVLASDGAANGFNYEDGSFAPDEVIERIHAINAAGGLMSLDGTPVELKPEEHPFFKTLGAQTTVSRWYADDVQANGGFDRTLRTVFTHDHFGPSTHQQVGLYAGLVIEPSNSKWRDPETGEYFGGRFDGGPTSWRADILTSNTTDSYREFLLEFADFQHAYTKEAVKYPDPKNVINPPAKKEVGLPFLLAPPDVCPGGVPVPCPEAVSADDVGTMVVNYRNEPLALRVRDPNTNTQAAGLAGDLSYAFRSDITRNDADFNSQPAFYPPLTGGLHGGDPFTPLLRAYEDDKVQVRILVGGHEEGHNFAINGVKWLFEPSLLNSGFRNSQMMGISEHYEFIIPSLPKNAQGDTADYLWTAGRATDDLWNGLWGLMRGYKATQKDLLRLPNNVSGKLISNIGDFNGVCPKTAPVRTFNVSAVRAIDVATAKGIIYNSRTMQGGVLHDPTGIMYVRDEDLDPLTGKLLKGVSVEPLVLRAAAGECIAMNLTNRLPDAIPADLDGFSTLPMIVRDFNNNQIRPSRHVGLHPQLLLLDVTRDDGMNVGLNPTQTAAPGHKVAYRWYAGDLNIDSTGYATSQPIEFGAINLMPADTIKHPSKGAFGALIIEPPGSTWTEVEGQRAAAVVTHGTQQFHDFVLQFQTDVNMRFGATNTAVPNLAEAEDPEDSGQKAVNYRTEPMWKRMNFAPDTDLETTRTFDFSNAFSNTKVAGDPQTPVFYAKAGMPTRMRVLTAGGKARNNALQVHGHIWRELPYSHHSTVLWDNPRNEFAPVFMGIGASSHFDLLLRNGAGGKFRVLGDYMFRSQPSFLLDGGLWGILRVE